MTYSLLYNSLTRSVNGSEALFYNIKGNRHHANESVYLMSLMICKNFKPWIEKLSCETLDRYSF